MTDGKDYESAATAAVAVMANVIAQTDAAEHEIVSEKERCATMESRFYTPSVGDGNETTDEASMAVAMAVENGYKSALNTNDGTPAKGIATGAAATANGNENATESAHRGLHTLEPVDRGPEEAASKASAGREEPEASRSATSVAVVPSVGSMRNAAELSCPDDTTSAEAVSKWRRIVAPSDKKIHI